ncbi:MAG: type IV pilus assembly protein PilM [Dissulfurispiraceae bacterium]
MLFKKKDLIGLDIGSSYIKVAQIDVTRSGNDLVMFNMVPLLPDIIVDGLIADKDRLVTSIKELLSMADVKVENMVIGVSGHSFVIVKRITIPLMTEDDLALSIRYEAEQYIPFDINEVNIDFQILGPRQDQSGQMDVIIVAAKKKVIEDYVDVITRAGLTPVIVDVESFALSNVYELNYTSDDKKNVALVNIGANSTNIVILQNGSLIFTRDSPIGSTNHTVALEKALNISREDAERLKKGFAVERVSPEEAQVVINGASDEIIVEVYKSFEYFRNSVSDVEIQEIVLSGGVALMPGFRELMNERLRIPVTVADPFKNLRINPKLDPYFIKDIAPIASVAVGLALRREREG